MSGNQRHQRRRHAPLSVRSLAAVRSGELATNLDPVRSDARHEGRDRRGRAFDLALLPRSAIDELVQAGKIAAGSVTDVVRSLVGLMVRTGAAEPDISSVEAFKSVLRQAKAISYSKGPSGLYVAELLRRLGLAAEMEDKTVFAIGRPVGEVPRSRAVPLSRSPSTPSAVPRLLCVVAHCSGTRSRVCASSAARKAATASSSRAVPLSRSPERFKRHAQVVLRRRPVEWSPVARTFLKRRAISGDRLLEPRRPALALPEPLERRARKRSPLSPIGAELAPRVTSLRATRSAAIASLSRAVPPPPGPREPRAHCQD